MLNFKGSGKTRIKDAFKEKKQEDDDANDDPTNKPKTPFTQEQLTALWKDFAENERKNGKQLFFSILSESEPVLQEDQLTILFTVGHVSGELEFNNEKQYLLAYLKEKLNNYHIIIQHEVKELKQEQKLYTNRDKYEYLKEKYPELAELRKRFDMDIDF